MKALSHCLFLVLFFPGPVLMGGEGEECSTVVVSGLATPDGRPLLWKNRDSDKLSNKVVYVVDRPHSFLALVNADDSAGVMVWAGLNSAGFAIANSVAYNLPRKSDEYADLEGIIMAAALRTCSTVDDFESFLKSRLGPDLGSQANFCVIDARGGCCILEVQNHAYKRYDARDFPERYIVNTNFSRSGTEDLGSGYLRFDRETVLFKAAPQGTISCEYILQTVARDLGHPLLAHETRKEWRKHDPDTPLWIHTNHTINRGSTAGAVVIQGVEEGEDAANAIMWVALGEPVCTIAIPLWVAAGTPPPEMREGEHSKISEESRRLKNLLRPLRSRERKEYVDVTRLDNRAGTGWLPVLLDSEKKILVETADLEKRNPTAGQRAEFERSVASRVLGVLQRIP